ncbi:hypothetical protein N2152v2_005234 [Parachlorella kessleri]
MQQMYAAWSGPFLAAARDKQAQQARAAALRQKRLLAASLLTWRRVFLPGARSRRQAWQRAEAFWRVNTLHGATAAWRQYVAGQLGKRARLEELQQQLLPRILLRVLLAWRAVALSRQRLRHFWLVWRDAAHTAAVLRRVERLESVAGQQEGQAHSKVSADGMGSRPRYG